MIVFRTASWFRVAALLALGVPLVLNSALAQERGPRGAAEEGEVLTRGPVHEAFAETVTFDPEPGHVAPKAPPAAIEEVPPDQRPEGVNVAWIPGYWAWDDERTDFLWVSGIWRALPPGRQWMPGYWGKSPRGSQWTSGYWADAKLNEVEYLPEPPATVEVGPNVAAPSVDHRWLPGCWLWQQNRYAWRPGYWAAGQSDWDWVPAHYVWSPRGYVFVGGYYDYSVARRGVLFAPVYFRSNIYSQRGFSYSPVTVINPAVFASHLFLRPSYGHYYFGDYYASNYSSSGFSPWFSYHSSRYGYDPFYAQQRWNHRTDREWDRRVEADFAHRRDHEEARPPRTWTAQRVRSTAGAANIDKSFVVAASFDDLAKSKDSPIRLQPVAKVERQQISQRGQEFRTAREERQKLEAAAVLPSADAPRGTVKPIKVKLPRTPITSQPVDRLGKDAPPQVIEAPQPDIKIEPKPRKPRGNAEGPTDLPKATKPNPRPERPKAEPKEKPQRDPNDAPKGGSDDRPRGGSKGPPKGEGKNKPKS
jgi:WXXGXW repeat (2 copies)